MHSATRRTQFIVCVYLSKSIKMKRIRRNEICDDFSRITKKNYYFFYLSVEFCGAMSCSQLLKHTLTPIKIMIINSSPKTLSIESNPNGWALLKVFREMFADFFLSHQLSVARRFGALWWIDASLVHRRVLAQF